MGEYNGIERRKHPRVEYPPGKAPRLVIDGDTYPVVDIAERGVKFRASRQNGFNAGLREVSGRIEFSDDRSAEVEGAIIRVEKSELSEDVRVVIFLYEEKAIPRTRIETEQAFVNGGD